MNGRKARARRRAQKRSRENTFAKRAAAVEISEREKAVRAELADAAKERDLVLASANKAFRDGVKALSDVRADDRARAYADFDAARNRILKKYAEQELEAA